MSLVALTPSEIVQKVHASNTKKISNPLWTTILLGVLAGAYIGLGALFYTIVKADPTYSFATRQIFGGLVFCIGLVLVIIAGAELFTGNNLLVISWARNEISTRDVFRNWIVIFFSNMVGAVSLAVLVFLSGHLEMYNGAIGEKYIQMAEAKCNLPFAQAFFRGLLCNILVCLAVWMAMAGRSVSDKILAIIFPITLFVAAGFEHSIANMFIIPLGIIISFFGEDVASNQLTVASMMKNIVPVVLGNIVGGSVFVGLMYHYIFSPKNR